jgi:predicted nucleotidyltransferase
MGPIGRIELVKYVADVSLHGSEANEEPLSDLDIAVAFRD